MDRQNMYLCSGKPSNNAPFLLTIAISVYLASLAAIGQDGNGLQIENVS